MRYLYRIDTTIGKWVGLDWLSFMVYPPKPYHLYNFKQRNQMFHLIYDYRYRYVSELLEQIHPLLGNRCNTHLVGYHSKIRRGIIDEKAAFYMMFIVKGKPEEDIPVLLGWCVDCQWLTCVEAGWVLDCVNWEAVRKIRNRKVVKYTPRWMKARIRSFRHAYEAWMVPLLNQREGD